MQRITFTRDVPHEDGEGVAYRAGYQADVSDRTAARWVARGDAKLGAHKIAPPKRPLKGVARDRAISSADLNKAGNEPKAD